MKRGDSVNERAMEDVEVVLSKFREIRPPTYVPHRTIALAPRFYHLNDDKQ